MSKRTCDRCHREASIENGRKICHGCRNYVTRLNKGEIRPPDYAEVNVANYKEPMEKVADGFGYYGAITTTNDGKHIQCHICGFYLGNLSSHIKKAHGISSRDYKIKYGLRINDGLYSPEALEKVQATYNAGARKSPEEFKEMSRKGREARERNAKKRAAEPWNAQVRNEKGMCREQTIAKITALAESLGRVPSQREFAKEYGEGQAKDTIVFWFKSWSNALKQAGMKDWSEQLSDRREQTIDRIKRQLTAFYNNHGRTPQYSDFVSNREELPSADLVRYYYPTLNHARQDSGIPILVYSTSARAWVEVEPGQELQSGDMIRVGRTGMVAVN